METPSTAIAYRLGCNQGNLDRTYSKNSSVALLFGGQNSDYSGTESPAYNIPFTNLQIEQAASEFAHGYWACTAADTSSILTLSVSTNNNRAVSGAAGTSWGGTVTYATQAWVDSHYPGQEIIWGGNDLEPGWSAFGAVNSWVASYMASSNYRGYLDMGSADGCPPVGSCINGWNQFDEWWASWGAASARAATEDYSATMINQWHLISNYGAVYQGSKINFTAPWDDHPTAPAAFTAQQAWDDLTYLEGVCPYSMEIMYEPTT